jgi:hypothetical protein
MMDTMNGGASAAEHEHIGEIVMRQGIIRNTILLLVILSWVGLSSVMAASSLKRAQIALDTSYEIERLRIVGQRLGQFTEDEEVLPPKRMDPRVWIV